MTSKEILEEKIEEIQSYYGVSLTELVIELTKEPIVRHFKGNYYRVVGVGTNCSDESPMVVYKELGGSSGLTWTRELTEFLSPVPEDRQELNVTGQKRRFELIKEFSVQLDLVSTKDLSDELSKREKDILRIDRSAIWLDDYVLARVIDGGVYNIVNTFASKEDAENNLERNRRHRKLLSDDFKILHRVIFED